MDKLYRASHLTRRQFGMLAGATGMALSVSPPSWRAAFAQEATDSAQIITGKASGMLVHNAKLGVMETPLTMLRKFDHTPKDILFNRLHFPHEGSAAWYATTAAPTQPDWAIRIDGLVQRPRIVTLADLAKMDQVKRVSVIQCAGNGRSYYAAKEKLAGGQWKNGGMGNVVWEGVPLRQFLEDQKLGGRARAGCGSKPRRSSTTSRPGSGSSSRSGRRGATPTGPITSASCGGRATPASRRCASPRRWHEQVAVRAPRGDRASGGGFLRRRRPALPQLRDHQG